MRKITILILFLLILISTGCTDLAPAPTQEPKSKLPVIVHIKTKNEIITVFSGQTEPLYNVMTKDGEILGRYLSAQELHENLPNIYRILKTSYADNHPNDVIIWTGIEH